MSAVNEAAKRGATSISELFIRRPVATTLLTIGITLAGLLAFFRLPVSPLPQVDFPTIAVSATMAGASPQVMATSVATPLERHLGQIADVSEMTSQSSAGSTRVTLQFGLNRDIDGAARDVQAAINASRADLPTALRSNPTYRKMNPADSPILILALTSETRSPGQMYDAASTILAQKISQISGIGQVNVAGSALPAVRVELNPFALFKYGIGLEDVRAALAAANANSPKGIVDIGELRYQLYANDVARHAEDYKNLIIAYRNKAAVRLSDVGQVTESVENVRNLGLLNGKPAVLLILFRQPGANIIDTVDRVKALLPSLANSIPQDIDIHVENDRSVTIRASLKDVERTLLIAIALVILVVFLFLRNGRATLVPATAVPVSLIGTFGVMYLLGFSLDNLSLMALIVATGFVVDDAIVVLENISRHLEEGLTPVEAALRGAREVSFTVISMSISLVAVFIPILMMGGIVGRLFREFSITLAVAVLVSMLVSLTTTPMMCSRLLKAQQKSDSAETKHGIWSRWSARSERAFNTVVDAYGRSLRWALRHHFAVLTMLFAALALNIYLYIVIPKGFFPQQDTGRIMGGVMADQSTSFQAMTTKLKQLMDIVRQDPDVAQVIGFTGGGQINSATAFIGLKPKAERKESLEQFINRMRPKMSSIAGTQMFMVPEQDIRIGGRQSNSQYQYTLQADDIATLYTWAPKLTEALKHVPQVTDVNSDQQLNGQEIAMQIDRDTAARLGLDAATVDNNLYDAFGQRSVSTIYNPLNQYHVIMELAPEFWQSPETLKSIWISTSGGSVSGSSSTNAVAGTVTSSTSTTSATSSAARNKTANTIASANGSASTGSAVATSSESMIPLAAISQYGPGKTALSVNHQGPFVATTISFNLPLGVSLSDATVAINQAALQIGMPATVHGSFQGTARTFQASLDNQPILILAALVAVYIVLGILYESYIHPLTILSTLPSAGAGAVLALRFFNAEFDIIALIGVILLVGIVKKNAIMMIDVALAAQRNQGMSPVEAIYNAAKLRFRPILMTTLAALFGAIPLALGHGDGAELRQPLGISIVGGLIVSQILTLYTTPVIYLYMDRFGQWAHAMWQRFYHAAPTEVSGHA